MGNYLCFSRKEPESQPVPSVQDRSANGLSYVGEAAYEELRMKHAAYHQSMWNVTQSKVVGSLQHTPGRSTFESKIDPKEGHSNWFPEKMCEVMSKTTEWCDVMSLAAPDGYFLEQFKKALKNIAENNQENAKNL